MKKVTTFLIIGAAAGAAIWFFNTKKGRQVMGDIKDGSNELAGKIKSGLNSVKRSTAGAVEKGKQYVSSMNNKVQETPR